MGTRLCYGAFGVVTVVALYLWTTYMSLFHGEKAYVYNPETTDVFEITMSYSLSSIHFWDYLNPFTQPKRRDPELEEYLGLLSELRDRVRLHNSSDNYLPRFDPDAPASIISIEYFRKDDRQLDHNLVPAEWHQIILNGSADIILANAVIITQDWPDGYSGKYAWPVEVNLASDVVIFFGRSTDELCVQEMTREFPKLEGIVREVGCFFPN